MFAFRRNDPPSHSRQPEKPSSRPRSLSSRPPSSSSSASSANAPLLPRRAPLAPLDPQSTNAALALDDQMSSASSSSSFLGYNPPDNPQDTDPARFNIGRPIIPRTAPDELSGNLPSSSRRRSIPNQAQSSSTVSRPPLLQSLRPLPRRSSHTPSSSISSSRRTSLPTILQPPNSKAAPSPPSTHTNDNAHALNPADDIYSNLSTFTFGAARSNPPRRSELVSPFTVSAAGPTDRTPRPSVSGASSRTRTPRTQPKEIQDGGERADDEDEEEAARQNRAKMRAIDDGTRRPSLPINAHSGPAEAASPPRLDTDSEAELDSATTYDDGEELDTDVEFDYRNFSRDDVSDTASIHTFGEGARHYAPPGPARADRMSMAMSIVDVDDEDELDDDVPSPVTFTRIRDSGAESIASSPSSPPQSRRGSVPWAIPGNISSAARDREDSEATILAAGRRPSRSLNDEHGHAPTPSSSAHATSQPTSRADFQSLEVQVVPEEGSSEEQAPPEELVSDTYEGFNLQYILGDGGRRSWSSGAPSIIAPASDSRRPSTSIVPWESYSISSGRRSSTTTMSDDAFTSQLRKLDKNYLQRREEWSFRKETADGSGANPAARVTRPAIHELWRHQYVGRFKVDKQWTEHPSKAPTQRINVRHIADPYSRGNTRGGPHSIIHRHSRAVAFSIFRKYGLFGRTHKPGGTSFHVHTSGTILLATMDVQAQFTSTRTTSQLNAHGLLSDGSARPGDKDRERQREKAKAKEKSKEKDKAKQKVKVGSETSSSQTASVSSVGSSQTTSRTTAEEESPLRQRPAGSSPSSVPVSPTLVSSSFSAIATTSYAPSVSTTAVSVRGSLDTRSPAPSLDITMSPGDRLPPSIPRVPLREVDAMELDEEDHLVHPRTSHAEAFATLDSGSIDYIRGRSDHHHHGDHDSSGGGFMERIARRMRIRGQNVRVVAPRATPSPDVPFTPTVVPWVTLAPRSKQEERERVIQNLNESFKDVGLLPTFKTSNRGERAKGKQPMKNHAGVNVFEEVPPDALHMLLPLWPCNTDEGSTVEGEDPGKYVLPVEQRQYLIVYYVPFDERKEKGKKKTDANKKRSRADSLATPSTAAPKTKGIPRSAFRVCARLVSYHDFLGTGVRLPSEGLTITGSMAEAMANLPEASIRAKHPGDMVIGVCSGRDRDIEFVPEGLACVGLCTAVEELQPPQPPSPAHEEEMMDEFDPVFSLTPIGRAAVEMAWLGCLAITFSDANPPQAK